MKKIVIIELVFACCVSMGSFAGEPYRVTVEASNEKPQVVYIRSGKEMVAEVKIKDGSLKLEGKEILYTQTPGTNRTYNCSGEAKLDLLVDGKSLMKVTADLLIVQPATQVGANN